MRGIPYYAAEAYTGDYMRTYCKLDLRVPKGTNGFATIVSFHGGGLVRGQRGDFSRTKRDDVASVSAGYRLLTNATPVECVSDAAAAVAWTLKHIAEYGGDPKKVFVTGYSGGGYLAMMVGKDGVERWETTADDAIRLAELVAHRGTWHGKSLVPAETAAEEFPLPYVFADRLVAGTDGSSSVLFTRRDVSKEPSFVQLTTAWREIIGK